MSVQLLSGFDTWFNPPWNALVINSNNTTGFDQVVLSNWNATSLPAAVALFARKVNNGQPADALWQCWDGTQIRQWDGQQWAVKNANAPTWTLNVGKNPGNLQQQSLTIVAQWEPPIGGGDSNGTDRSGPIVLGGLTGGAQPATFPNIDAGSGSITINVVMSGGGGM